MITVKLHLNLTNYTGKQRVEIPAAEPVILKDLLEEMGVPIGEVGLIVKNGRWNTAECSLSDGDIVELFPYLSGG
ncbi:MAG: hypothetical protein HPY74_12150 [Firmicutes bacterium]|nr:hypothetical protein [Bacillota bacterium]NSW91402.1 hypothetical protein [Bacillota bacterium]